MLTEQQLSHFQTFGFLVFRQLFSRDELKTIYAEFKHGLESAYHNQPFNGTHRYWVTMMGPETPFFATLLEDPRFCETAEQLYGEDVMGVGTDANRYVGNTHWHPDHDADPAKDCYGVKFAYYLEPVDADSGSSRGHTRIRFTVNCGKIWVSSVLRSMMFPVTSANRSRVTWSLSICAAGMQVGVAVLTAECVRWFITTTPRHPKRRQQPVFGQYETPKRPRNLIGWGSRSITHTGLRIVEGVKNVSGG